MADGHRDSSVVFRLLVGSAALVIILAALRAASAVVVPLLVALLVAVVCMPAVVWLEKRKVPRPLALTIVLAGLAAALVALAAVVGASTSEFTERVPYYEQRLVELKKEVLEQLAVWGVDIPDPESDDHLDPALLMDLIPELLEALNSFFSGLFLVVLLVIFILLDTGRGEVVLRLYGKTGAAESLDRIKQDVRRYMVLKVIASLVQGSLIALWLGVLGMDYPLLWGLLGGLLNFIPQVGGIVAAAVPGIFALIEHGLGTALLVGLGIGAVTTVVENFLQPKLMKKGLGLSMLTVIVVVMLWGWLLGPIGMFMAVPLTTVLKRVLEENEETQWVAALLGDPPSELEGGAPAVPPDKG